MSDPNKKIEGDLKQFEDTIKNSLKFIHDLNDKENLVADHFVNKICKNNDAINRPAVELLLDELATIDEKIKQLDYHHKTLNIEREVEIPDGRVDIVISIDEDKIYIENKILALDQSEQLKRYKNENPYSLIYLTRYGHKASPRSEKGLRPGKDYFLASYYLHIYNWIKKLKEIQYSESIIQFWDWLKRQIYGNPDLYEFILNNREHVKIHTIEKCKDGFRHYIMWKRIIPELRRFAESNNLWFEVSDRFEFKSLYSYIRFVTSDNKEIKFRCGPRTNNFWSGINVKGTPISPCNWDSQALLYYDDIVKAVITKVKEEINAC